MDCQIFREQLYKSKLNGLRSSLYHWKALGTYISKMGFHNPFGHLKHKLWPKEGSRVKLAIWLLTTKSKKSPKFPWFQVACDIPLDRSRQGLQLCSRPHFNRRSTHKVMGPQSCRNPSCKNFGTHTCESREKMPFHTKPSWRGTKYTIRGKVVASPKSGPWWVLWVRICPWLVLTPKMFQLCTNQLVVWFCVGLCEWLSVCHLP